ncbi:MAG: hypothetical protein CVV51_14615 [Spirochaetae bacterium HGW-Spirochaetae-7]|jgi:hypothetical protein|nr:MAG: hypothetical protein CVV51_14615 [Spirochaetae bacterium HGW-Spirochaetae-7]
MARLARSLNIRSMARGTFMSLAGAAAVLIVAVALVWPLWYLATRHTALYTWLALLSLAAAAIYAVVAKLSRRKADDAIDK